MITPSFQKQFTLVVDATVVACGGVLMQLNENEVDHPIAYYSKKFLKHQQNYSTIEKECLD